MDFILNGIDIEDSQEEFDVAFRGRDHVGYLIAVCAIETNDLIAGDLLEIRCHLLRRLA